MEQACGVSSWASGDSAAALGAAAAVREEEDVGSGETAAMSCSGEEQG
jgi:hypothetical protein